MIRTTVRVAVWLAVGTSMVALLYWAFLQTPESNALTLATSAGLLVALVFATGVFANAAVLLAAGLPLTAAGRRAAGGVLWFAIAVMPFVLAWWIVGRADAWVALHSGSINAWLIARMGWADAEWLFRAIVWTSRWLLWVVAPLASIALLASLLHNRRALHGGTWIRRAWHWRTVMIASGVFVLLVALPWQLVYWRPDLPPTWVQPVVAGLRLGTVAVSWLLAGALVIVLAVRSLPAPRPAHPPEVSTHD
jgi:hypothetical protein